MDIVASFAADIAGQYCGRHRGRHRGRYRGRYRGWYRGRYRDRSSSIRAILISSCAVLNGQSRLPTPDSAVAGDGEACSDSDGQRQPVGASLCRHMASRFASDPRPPPACPACSTCSACPPYCRHPRASRFPPPPHWQRYSRSRMERTDSIQMNIIHLYTMMPRQMRW